MNGLVYVIGQQSHVSWIYKTKRACRSEHRQATGTAASSRTLPSSANHKDLHHPSISMKTACIAVLCLALAGPTQASFLDHIGTLSTMVKHMVGFGDNTKPSFCNSLDCPEFAVINKTDDYELREYSASNWVSTNLAGIDFDEASSQLFMRLFRYISGSNAQQKKIAMTAPVIDRIIPGQGPACESNFTMSFFISSSVTSPPAPTDPTVFLETKPSMRVYVKSFGGYAEMSDWIEHAMALADALPATARYHCQFYYTAGYDAPFKFFNRHNEVWFISE